MLKKAAIVHPILGIIASILLCLIVSVVLSPRIRAADDARTESIVLSPTAKDYKLKAGEVKQDTLTLINDGNVPYQFTLYTRPYSVKTANYEQDFITNATNADAYQWVQFDESSYYIKPNETKKVKYTIRVPEDATPGGHYGVIFAETQTGDSANSNAVQRKKRVGTIMYTTVNGTYSMGGRSTQVAVPFFQLRPPITATVGVENTGNSHFTVAASMVAKDVFGNKKAEVTKDYVVLPKTNRIAPLEWSNSPWFGFYKVDITLKYLDKTETTSHSVLIVPVWVYLVVVGVIIARMVYAIRHRKA